MLDFHRKRFKSAPKYAPIHHPLGGFTADVKVLGFGGHYLIFGCHPETTKPRTGGGVNGSGQAMRSGSTFPKVHTF
jgi:hypothetical protein